MDIGIEGIDSRQKNIEYGPTNPYAYRDSFKYKIKLAAESGLLLFIKYGLILLLIYVGINYVTRINQAALNGEQAAIIIREYQIKGYLPSVVNGSIPIKVNDVKETSSNIKP